MRRIIAAIAMAAACTCLLPGRPAHAATAEEAVVVADINAVRASRGLRPLEPHPELERKAQDWAAHLAATGTPVHTEFEDGITADWLALAENVAADLTLEHAQQQLMSSPIHFANIVDPDMTHVGVGVVAGGGHIYVVEEFMQLQTSPATTPPTTTTETETTTAMPATPATPVTTATTTPVLAPASIQLPAPAPPEPAPASSSWNSTPPSATAHPVPAESTPPPSPVAAPAAPHAVAAAPSATHGAVPEPPATPAAQISAGGWRSTVAGSPEPGTWILGGLVAAATAAIVRRARPRKR